jgi:serine/threonine protein kinase
VNGYVFEEFPFILSVKNETSAKLIKILRVPDGSTELSVGQDDVKYEIGASEFKHEAIVPMEYQCINVDLDAAIKANCRVGSNDVLIMPWYLTTLHKLPSNDLRWIAFEGNRIKSAIEYIHDKGFVHLDIKAMNIFVDADLHWYLGDFGSCKPIGQRITSSTFQFYYEDMTLQLAQERHDWFMLLLMILIESLTDRKTYRQSFYNNSKYARYDLTINYANSLIDDPDTIAELKTLLRELCNKLD